MAVVDLSLVQKAVYDKLIADNVASGRVYDSAPSNVTFDYVEIGPAVDVEDDTSDGQAIEHNMTVDAWSRSHRGRKAVKDLVGAVRTSLHRANLTVAGLSSCLTWVDGATYQSDPDGVTEHGIVRVRLMSRQ